MLVAMISLSPGIAAEDNSDEARLAKAAEMHSQGIAFYKEGRYADAERLLAAALEIQEPLLAKSNPTLRNNLQWLSSAYVATHQYSKAIPLREQSLAITRLLYGPNHPEVASNLHNLAYAHEERGDFSQAEALYRRSIEIFEARLGKEHPRIANTRRRLASMLRQQGHYREAETLLIQTLAVQKATFGPNHEEVGRTLNDLGLLYRNEGRCDESEETLRQALRITHNSDPPDNRSEATMMVNLASTYIERGRYAEAQTLLSQALRIYDGSQISVGPQLAECLMTLAGLYRFQNRWKEAAVASDRVLQIQETAYGPDHVHTAYALREVAYIRTHQGQIDEAIRLLQRAQKIIEERLPNSDDGVAECASAIGSCELRRKNYLEAKRHFEHAITVVERSYGESHRSLANTLQSLAIVCLRLKDYPIASKAAKRAIEVGERQNHRAGALAERHHILSRVLWEQGRREEAINELKAAMRLADGQRRSFSGGGREHAQAFAEFSRIFECMVHWQAQLYEPSRAFEAIERGRTRSFLDEVGVSGTDILVGLEESAAQSLRERLAKAEAEVAAVEQQLSDLSQLFDLSEEDRKSRLEELNDRLGEARKTCARAYSDLFNESPVYRSLLTRNFAPVDFDEFCREASDAGTVVLEYFLGQDHSYVLAFGFEQPATLLALEMGDSTAATLGVEPGPVTTQMMGKVLANANGSGVLQQIRSVGDDSDANVRNVERDTLAKLASLWNVLVPDEGLRDKLTSGRCRRLLILPDGVLSQLPFEMLVVEPDLLSPKYLLDKGPPTAYAPSATVYWNLQKRNPKGFAGDALTVGNCRYSRNDVQVYHSRGDSEDVLAELRTEARYASLGNLTNLPWTKVESEWIEALFKQQGKTVLRLEQDAATEAAVREKMPGYRIVHLACHGLTDDQFGNLFGALAVTPGENADLLSDNGFLTLKEMFGLNLHACELAVLSACDTNMGPNQRGEGTWSICRGFLTSGAKRVVTTEWQVNDRASASLVFYFLNNIVRAEGSSTTPDYAEALHKAKLRVRQGYYIDDSNKSQLDTRLQHPYYWAPFVLMGPG